jgi:hypothetical protein
MGSAEAGADERRRWGRRHAFSFEEDRSTANDALLRYSLLSDSIGSTRDARRAGT